MAKIVLSDGYYIKPKIFLIGKSVLNLIFQVFTNHHIHCKCNSKWNFQFLVKCILVLRGYLISQGLDFFYCNSLFLHQSLLLWAEI